MKKNYVFAIAIAILPSITASAQLGNIKNKMKEKVKESTDPKTSGDKKETPASTTTEEQKPVKLQKDANGYVINDPEVAALLNGKDVWQSTDLRLYSDILGTRSSFKLNGVAVTQKNDSLVLFAVAQRQYGGVLKKKLAMAKMPEGHYQAGSSSERYYAVIQADQSILLFNSLYAELITKNENDIKAQTIETMKEKLKEPYDKIERAQKAEKHKKEIAENDKYFKSGDVKAVKSDPSLEAQFLKILKEENSYATVAEKDKASYSKIMLFYTDWTVVKNDLGIPLKMTYGAWAIGKYTMDNVCFYQRVYFKKDYIGGGKYGPVKFDEGIRPSEVSSCDIVK